ncbi:MAG: hypothetical protein AB7F67_03800 [Rhodospirillaceae bacterium]
MSQIAEALLYQNHVGPDPDDGATAVITADSEESYSEAVNLADPVVGRKWRTVTGTVAATLIADLGAQVSVQAVALVATNLTAAATRRIRLSTADATGAAGDALDTGTGLAGIDTRWGLLGYIAAAAATGRYLRLDLSDVSGAISSLEAGRLVAGPLTFPEHGFVFPFRRGRQGQVRSGRASGGAQSVAPKWSGRVWTANMVPTAAEANGWVQELHARNFEHTDVWLIRDVASTNLGRDSLFGLVTELRDIEEPDGGINLTSLTIDERL